MIPVADSNSIGAMHALADALGRRVGGSTGTNIWACMLLAEEMAAAGQSGSIVTLLCDGGDRYSTSYYDETWLASQQLNWTSARKRVNDFLGT